eukprot:CAMPEP_0197534372 /NCGR_PEP_ID=MMETSP1318-20131121/46917_1 /TAXON_ID=552666 /ORGANISM="Partenskyella glossopodia, Strain RCC365" /LENGTH=340 /DNA_ID=CAMNT_0043091613 /DNA_START=518 /DNA_END=1537 /DNA_ORIENTATION=+
MEETRTVEQHHQADSKKHKTRYQSKHHDNSNDSHSGDSHSGSKTHPPGGTKAGKTTSKTTSNTTNTSINTNTSTSRNNGKVAVVVVVHENSPTLEETILGLEKLLPLDDGTGSGPGPSQFQPVLMYDSNAIGPEQLPKTKLPLIAISKEKEKQNYPDQSYGTFSGIYGAPAKPAEISWVAAHEDVEYAWFIEGDVYFSGKWRTFLSSFNDDTNDLLAPEIRRDDPEYPDRWINYDRCDAATPDYHSRAFLPIHRISRKLAVKVKDYLVKGSVGHHECVLPSLCQSMQPVCNMGIIPEKWVGTVRYRPIVEVEATKLQQHTHTSGKLYHPVKTKQSAIDAR